MKCVGIQYLEAVERLMKGNHKLKRTIHISFVPGEHMYDSPSSLKTKE